MAAELEASTQSNLYDAVRQLRPGWFTRQTARGGSDERNIIVYIDDRMLGNTSSLSRFSPRDATRVRYLTATEAQVKYGQQNAMRAAIVIETGKP